MRACGRQTSACRPLSLSSGCGYRRLSVFGACSAEPGKCCKTYMLYVVYQYNIISCVLSKKQGRNKINNLSDSPLFTFHLVSSFALGCTKMFFKPFSPTTSRSSENILLKRIDELLQPKEKMSKSISSDYIRRNFYYPQR